MSRPSEASGASVANTDADSVCYNSLGIRKVVRLFISHENTRDTLELPEGKSVAAIKQIVKDRFKIRVDRVQLGDVSFERNTLVLAYAGAELHDNWILADMGIKSGAILKAYVKKETDPVLFLRIGYTQEVIPIIENISLRNYPVASLRAIASRRSGLPVGIFRMTNAKGVEMFDWHTLDVYNVKPGDCVNIETWDGWNEFLKLASLGFSSHLIERVAGSDEVTAAFQLKVALYMAAHFGQVELSTTLVRQHGVRCDEPVGQHPLKRWCTAMPHPDLKKAPIHEAVESGQLAVLRGFVHQDVCSIMVRDGNNLQPLNLALRLGQKTCASFLLTKQWSRVSFHKSTVPLAIFARMKNWSNTAKSQVSTMLGQDKSSLKKKQIKEYPLVGQGVYIDGFSLPQLNSAKRPPPPKPETAVTRAVRRYYASSAPGNPEEHFKLATRALKIPKIQSKWSKMAGAREAAEELEKLPQLSRQKRIESKPGRGSRNSSLKSAEAGKRETAAAAAAAAAAADGQAAKEGRRAQAPKQESATMLAKAKNNEGALPLPLHSVQDTPRPFLHLRSGQENQVKQAIGNYCRHRGVGGREYAIRCLSVAQGFKEKPWLHQVRLAMSFTEAGVRRMTSENCHNLLSADSV